METATPKVGAQKDVHTLINDKVIELFDKGIVPWRMAWLGGLPRNLISRKPYRNINLLLLSCLGYEHNLFITERQMKDIGASILPGERPHMVAYWNYKDEPGKKQAPQLRYYLVYNIGQCSNISEDFLNGIGNNPLALGECKRIVEDMPHKPDIRNKESMAYYDTLEDYVNMPKPKAFKNEFEQYSTLFHQLIHSTGHHTRLDRMGLAQMAEYGYIAPSQEELVADIGTRYLEAFAGVIADGGWDDEYPEECKARLKSDRNFFFTAASLAQKAVDFILSEEIETEEAVAVE